MFFEEKGGRGFMSMAKIGFNSRVIQIKHACKQELSHIYVVLYGNIYDIILYQSFVLKCLLKQSTEYLET